MSVPYDKFLWLIVYLRYFWILKKFGIKGERSLSKFPLSTSLEFKAVLCGFKMCVLGIFIYSSRLSFHSSLLCSVSLCTSVLAGFFDLRLPGGFGMWGSVGMGVKGAIEVSGVYASKIPPCGFVWGCLSVTGYNSCPLAMPHQPLSVSPDSGYSPTPYFFGGSSKDNLIFD